MKRTIFYLLALLAIIFTIALYGAVVNGHIPLQVTTLGSCSTPACLYVSSSNNQLTCLLSGGSSCMPAGTGISSLTTTGTSGAATFSGGVLNIPVYSSGGGGGWLFAPTAPPNSSTLTWVNQGGATVANQSSPSALMIHAPASSGDNLRCLVKSAPSTPWTFTIAFFMDGAAQTYMYGGIALVAASGGKVETFNLSTVAGGVQLQVAEWNSTTSFSSDASATGVQAFPFYVGCGLVFMRVTDNGTNLVFSIGNNLNDASNSPNFNTVILTQSRTAWLSGGPGQAGIYCGVNNGSVSQNCTFVHWTGI